MGRTIPQKEQEEYTHKELQAAIRKFESEGGLVQKLPDQTNPKMREVSVKQ